MERVVLFLHNPSKQQLETANKWLTLLDDIHPEVRCTPAYRIEDILQSGMIIITFGHVGRMLVEQRITEGKLTGVIHVALHALKDLVNTEACRDYRAETKQKLLELKALLAAGIVDPSTLVVRTEDLPALRSVQVLLLKQLADQAGRTHCLMVSRQGKRIAIGACPPETVADLQLEWSELFALQATMETLQVTEVTLVRKP